MQVSTPFFFNTQVSGEYFKANQNAFVGVEPSEHALNLEAKRVNILTHVPVLRRFAFPVPFVLLGIGCHFVVFQKFDEFSAVKATVRIQMGHFVVNALRLKGIHHFAHLPDDLETVMMIAINAVGNSRDVMPVVTNDQVICCLCPFASLPGYVLAPFFDGVCVPSSCRHSSASLWEILAVEASKSFKNSRPLTIWRSGNKCFAK